MTRPRKRVKRPSRPAEVWWVVVIPSGARLMWTADETEQAAIRRYDLAAGGRGAFVRYGCTVERIRVTRAR